MKLTNEYTHMNVEKMEVLSALSNKIDFIADLIRTMPDTSNVQTLSSELTAIASTLRKWNE